MQRIPRMIADMLENDPKLLVGIIVVLAIFGAGAIYARITKPRRMRKHAKIRRPRN